MRKSYIKMLTLGAAVALCAMTSNTDAKVTGKCDNCHTMHNSQNGIKMGKTATANDFLTTDTCAGCHSGPGTAQLDPTTKAPIVVVTTNTVPSIVNGLINPGGFIRTLGSGGLDSWKHNVAGTDAIDVPLGVTPPGYKNLSIGLPSSWSFQLTCAGNLGCHGDHTITDESLSIAGGHHNDTAVGFRLLKAINGVESNDYSVGAGGNGVGTAGNIYSADNIFPSGPVETTTINYLCAECHGNFHAVGGTGFGLETGTASPWLRHPTDNTLPALRPDLYQTYGDAGNLYHKEAPVGKPGILDTHRNTGAEAMPTDNTGVVLCISCHRAHGSEQPDLLRWAYSGMEANTNTAGVKGTGCFRCHTEKDRP